MLMVISRSNSDAGIKDARTVMPHITLCMFNMMLELYKTEGQYVMYLDKKILTALFVRKIVRRTKGDGESALITLTNRGKKIFNALK